MAISLTIKGPIPRKAPYVKFRSIIYVPSDVKRWRRKLAEAFLKAGGRRPEKGERVVVSYLYGFVKSHADHDSITHSAQDALSKDALHCSDKEWFIGFIRSSRVAAPRNEFLTVIVEYQQEVGDGK